MQERTDDIRRDLIGRIAAVRRRIRQVEVRRGVLLVVLVTLGSILCALVVEETFRFDPAVRTTLFWLLVVVCAGATLRFVAVPVLKGAGLLSAEADEEIAERIGEHYPEIQDRLVNGLQLFAEQERASAYYSPELIDAALRDLRAVCAPLDFSSMVSGALPRRLARILGIVTGCAILLLMIFPEPFLGSATRLWNYRQSFAAPPRVSFLVAPGDAEVIKGQTVRLVVRIQGEPQHHLVLTSRREGESITEIKSLGQQEDSSFVYEFASLKTSTDYSLEAAGVRSREYRLTVVDRPVVKILRLSLRFPPYSGIPPRDLDDNVGDVTALKGTRVSLAIESNNELTGAEARFGDGVVLPFRTRGEHAVGDFLVTKERTYHLWLRNLQGAENADPITYFVRVQQDGPPAVSILIPGMNVDVTDQTTLPLLVKITDDFGFTRLRLAYRLVHSKYEKPAEQFTYVELPLPPGTKTEATVPHAWKLAPLALAPEDVVQYYVEVVDNDMVSGPKSAVSDTYTLRLPSLEEVLAGADAGHDKVLEMMQEAMKQAEEARQNLEELKQDLKKDQPKPDWQDRKKAEELIKKYDEVQKQMHDVRSTMERMVNDLQKNQVLSPETLEKYRELQELMEQLNSPEFAEAMKRLQQSMQQMSAEEMRKALEKVSLSEEDFRKSIERTINLLTRIQIEQKLDEMIKRAEALQKEQQDLHDRTEASRADSSLADAARRQQDLAKEVGRVEQEMTELQAKMEKFPGDMPVGEMEKARRDLEQSHLQEQMSDIAKQLESLQSKQALAGQEQVSRQVEQFARQMQEVKKSLQASQQRQIVNAMRRVQQDLLELSRRQETLKKEAQNLDPNSSHFRENMQEQAQVMQDLGNVAQSLSTLSQKTFSVSPEMGRSVGEAFQRMGEAMRSLEQRNGTTASQQQGSAMAALNEAAQQAQAAVNGMMQAGSQGMGMAGLMQRLQQLTGKQQGINQETQGLTPQQAAEMGRLAADQGAIRKSLEELSKEATMSGQSSRMLGDLRTIAEEMREVQTDLAQGEISPETIEKQQRILSRLLDSQRSMQERDFEKRRKSETGSSVAKKDPAPIDLLTQEGKSRLRRDLLRALEEGYARDYQELIRKYFEALEQ
jgi:Domain of unknown function (DUF4175)